MSGSHPARVARGRGASVLLVLGGLAMAGLWVVFTVAHGPTSVNEGRRILGWDMHVWGLFLGVIPNALVVAGLLGLRVELLGGAVARVGYLAVIVGLVASAALDLVFRSLAPPLFLPIVAGGLVALGAGPGSHEAPGPSSSVRAVLTVMGLGLLAATVMAWIPIEVSDTYGGYRIYGAVAHLATGIGWAMVGALLWLIGNAR